MASRMLVVFDFDHTLVDDNTDTWITKLSEDVKQIQKVKEMCWTDRMSAVFRKLHEKKFRKLDFDICLQTLPFTEGMKELLHFLSNHNIDCIIISDSNTYFIDHLLVNTGFKDVFREIHTNPAYWNNSELLCVEHYHKHFCHRCPENLCKGMVLTNYLSKSCDASKTVLYIGDGGGDYCPTLQLKGKDWVFAREDYALLKLLEQNPPENNPTIISWNNGFDILAKVKQILDI